MDDKDLVIALLARMVREEYPVMPLYEIAFTWGQATNTEMEALKRLDV